MILADTSIWIEFFRKDRFRTDLEMLNANSQLCIHPFVIGELACGYLPNRRKTLQDLDDLIALPIVPVNDVRMMIEVRGLASKGIGLTDAQLIASCLTTAGTQIWTVDGPLSRVAEALRIRAIHL